MTLREWAAAIPDGEPNDAKTERLTVLASLALRAGVVPTLADLVDPDECAAWVAAQTLHRIEASCRAGLAAQPGVGPALVLAELDGGAALRQEQARATARQVAEERRAARR